LCPSPDSGSILIATIWILVIFSILTGGLAKIIATQLRLIKRIEETFKGQEAAKSVFVYFQTERRQEKTPNYDTLYELKPKTKIVLGNNSAEYTVIDEESKLNINTASAQMLARLPEINATLAEGITNSKSRPFVVKEEVLLVEGASEEIFLKIKDLITTFSDGRVNINTASAETMQALGMDDNLVAVIKDFRSGPDGEEGTEDDAAFESVSEIVSKLNSAKGLTAVQQAALTSLINQGFLSVQSRSFSLQIETKIFDKPAAKYVLIADSDRIKEWVEQ
jgi:DNA uptake protein ComE-like DNA-binding protein